MFFRKIEKKRIFVRLFLACFFWSVLAGESMAEERGYQTVIDARGRKVKISVPVQRIAVINENAMEIVRMLGAMNRVAAVSDYIAGRKNYWPELTDLPRAGGWRSPDYEAIASVKPDLVLCYGRSPGQEAERMLEPAGVKVLRLDFYRSPEMIREVRDLGVLLGESERAGEFIRWRNGIIDRIAEGVARSKRAPNVYLEGYGDYKTWGRGSGVFDMCVAAGGKNAAAEIEIPSSLITPEWVVAKNPEIIIKTAYLPGGYRESQLKRMSALRTTIMNRSGWKNIEAVRRGAVYILDSDVCSGPSDAVGTAYMAKWFHPGELADLNPEAVHREYLNRFQSIPYRGHYAYPAP
jgi:iron complex transport system substrate-binding protein